MSRETYLLPAFWAPALVNGDFSGMDDSDDKALTDWLAETFPADKFPRGAWCVDCDSDAIGFTHWHDAMPHVLACDAMPFTFET
jgi:hypothetical protein